MRFEGDLNGGTIAPEASTDGGKTWHAAADLPDVKATDRHRARAAFAQAFRDALADTLPHPAFEAEEWGVLAKYLP